MKKWRKFSFAYRVALQCKSKGNGTSYYIHSSESRSFCELTVILLMTFYCAHIAVICFEELNNDPLDAGE